jgi:tetrahydromethanopterin S-methyltransferase subunit F
MAEEEEYGQGVPKVINPLMGPIESVVEKIRYRGQLIARNQKLDSGVSATGTIGFAIGFIITIILTLVIPFLVWQVV